MYLPVLRTGIAGLTALFLLAAAMAVFFSSGPNTAQAATYNPTAGYKFCNGLAADFPENLAYDDPDLVGNPACTDPNPIMLNTAYDITARLLVPAGNSNFGSAVFTAVDSTFQISGDAAISDGAKVGGLSSIVNLGLLGGACVTELTVEFVLYDSTTTAGATNPLAEGTANRNRSLVTDYEEGTANGVINASDDGFVDGYQVIDGGVDINRDGAVSAADNGSLRGKTVTAGGVDFNGVGGVTGDDDGVMLGAGSPSALSTDVTVLNGSVDGVGDELGNADSPFVTNKVGFYNVLFDPDADWPGGPGDGTGLPSVAPLARYTGMARVPQVTGDWQLLTFFQFGAGSLKQFAADPDNRPHSFAREFRDLGATPNDAIVSLSILNDPTATLTSPSPIVDFCAPLDVQTMLKGTASSGQVRGKTPVAGSTHMITSWSYGQRDADNDGKENAFDTCPVTANSGTDADPGGADGIDDACDGGVGYPSSGNFSQGDVDGDGFNNRQDNCPQTPNGGAAQKNSEIQTTYISSAADGGEKTDSIGDICDGAIQTACVMTPPGGNNSNTVDDDGDTVVNDGCPGGPGTSGPNAESSTKGDNPTGTGNPLTTQGGYAEKMIFIPKCIENSDTDGDNDGYCAANDINDGNPAIRGYSVNRGPDTDGIGPGGGDKFGAAEELYIGTDYYDECGGNSTWPANIVDAGENIVDISDVLALKPVFNATVTTVAAARNDLVPSLLIDISDVLALKPVFNATCTP